MSSLTRAELEAYPGRNLTEQLIAHHEELPRAVVRAKRLQQTVDIRRFPGRDRIERVMQYLRASVPFADDWSEDGLREMAERVVASAVIIE